MTELAGKCYRQPPEIFERDLRHRLAEGVLPYAVMQELSKSVDRYVLAVLKQAGVDPAKHLDALGALDPKAPPYTEPLVEVLERLAAGTSATAQLGRMLDERIAARRGSPVPASAPAIPQTEHASLLLDTVATFLRGQLKLSDDLLAPMLDGFGKEAEGGDATAGTPTADGQEAKPGATESATESAAASGSGETAPPHDGTAPAEAEKAMGSPNETMSA